MYNVQLLHLCIEQAHTLRLLGVVINDTLTWTDHIDHIISKLSRSINLLRRLSWFLHRPLLVLYLKSYILPSMDYCDIVWNNCNQQDSSRLQTLFNYACRLVLHRPRHSSSCALWEDLGLTCLLTRGKLHLAELVYRCHNSLAPSYLSYLFHRLSHCHNTRTHNLFQPFHQLAHLSVNMHFHLLEPHCGGPFHPRSVTPAAPECSLKPLLTI